MDDHRARTDVLEMMFTIWKRLRDIVSSNDADNGKVEDDEEPVQGQMSENDEPCWVMGTVTNAVQQRLEKYQQKELKLDKLTQPGLEDAADYFGERHKK